VGIFAGACTTVPDGAESANDALEGKGGHHGLTLAEVQRAIAQNGAGWTAGKTRMSGLPADDRAAMLGVPLSEVTEDGVAVLEESHLVPRADPLPAGHDWRNVDGKSFSSPILDQGRCGSCVAFAAIATFETQLNIAAGDSSSPWQLSPQFLFSCGGGICGRGWSPASASKFIVNTGVPDNACLPYGSGPHGDEVACKSACTDAPARAKKALAVTTPTVGGAVKAKIKQALLKGPLMTTMIVYEDFMFYTGGVYKRTIGDMVGGHAVSIVGWNDADSAWIVRNSWGPEWGMGGYFEIAWNDSFSSLALRTWGLEVAPQGPYVALSGLRDGTLLSGRTPIEFNVGALSSPTTSWTLSNDKGEVARGTSVFDTTKVPDGVYKLRPHADEGDVHVDGDERIAYVLNGKETGSVRFQDLSEGQTIEGTLRFDVAVDASPVPATHLDWTITNAEGTVIVDRTTKNTGALVEIGWNTSSRPNGTYTIRVTAGAGSSTFPVAAVTVNVAN
jgi:hypothetical protein